MRVAIDGACWLNRRGYGRFTRSLVASLAALDEDVEYTLMTDFDAADAPPVPTGVRVVRVPARHPAARSASAAGSRSLPDLWTMSRALSRERFDVVFFPSVYSYVPITGPSRIALVIHDVIPEQFPEHVFPSRRAATQWALKLWAARRQADLVFTVSEASRQAIVQRFALAPERVAVISEAADSAFGLACDAPAMQGVLARWWLVERRYLLYVGGISPHKNLHQLIDAFAALRHNPHCSIDRLVLVGDFSGDAFLSAYDEVCRQVAARELGDAVTFTGYVDDPTLAHLYRGAAAAVLPSLWEGFGLPAVEAMACGAPVVASRRGALPEVVGAAGLLFEPNRDGDLQATLLRLLQDADLQARLRRLGPQRAAEFSWERAAGQTLTGLRTLMSTQTASARQLCDRGLSAEKEAR